MMELMAVAGVIGALLSASGMDLSSGSIKANMIMFAVSVVIALLGLWGLKKEGKYE